MESFNLINGDCEEELKNLISNGIKADLIVTSPPYDDLRSYKGAGSLWTFEKFERIAKLLYEILNDGCVLVWIVGDATKNGDESGTSFMQVLKFKEIGFKLHDTMIYEKNSSSFPAKRNSKRYTQIFEYMFILVKGKKIRNDITLICDKKNKWAGFTNWGKQTQYNIDGELHSNKDKIEAVPEYSIRNNIWKYTTGREKDKTGHPAVFPERLAEDHILSWSVEGDTVLDPFMGSGTTGKMSLINNRKFIGIELVQEYFECANNRINKYIKINNE